MANRVVGEGKGAVWQRYGSLEVSTLVTEYYRLLLAADLRVASSSAKFGVFCRRVGVPLIDGGTVRLPKVR